jgi:tetratricopeptide (TPR) repeat protein
MKLMIARVRTAKLLTSSVLGGLLFSLLGCGGSPGYGTTVRIQPALSQQSRDLRDAFFKSGSPKEMVDIVASAKTVDASGSIHLGLAGELARLQGRSLEGNDFFVRALRVAPVEDASHLIARLTEAALSVSQMHQVVEVLTECIERTPLGQRHVYGSALERFASPIADLDGSALARSTITGVLNPWLIGPFDNDQGKAFNIVYPPELSGVTSEPSPGTVLPVTWRRAPNLMPLGGLALDQLMSPVDWQTAYAQSEFELSASQPLEVRISTSDPVKVWVDGQQVFQTRTIERFVSDNVVIALKLEAGRHRVFVKTMNESGSWWLRMRLTGPGGDPLAGVFEEISVLNEVQNVVQKVDADKPKVVPHSKSAYERFTQVAALQRLGEHKRAVELSQKGLSNSKSIILTQQFASTLVENKERGRASDLLNALEKEHGESLPAISIALATFWSSQKMAVKARELLRSRLKESPRSWGLVRALVDNYHAEKWHEEAAVLLENLVEHYSDVPQLKLKLAFAYKRLKEYEKARRIYANMVRFVPNHWTALQSLYWLSIGNDLYDDALFWVGRIVKVFPHRINELYKVAEVYRRSGRYLESENQLMKLTKLQPTAGKPFQALGRIQLRLGKTGEALKLLRKSLERDPDNRKLANRVTWLGPQADGPWRRDVPTEDEIASLIASRDNLSTDSEGANVVYLLDDEVSWLQKDGSTYNIVTMVVHALNQAGRDEITRMVIRSGGQHQLLNAYAVNAAGQRIEASSIRGRSIRYRQLDVGSTVVVQYRIDSRPEAYLAGHIDRGFWFQARNTMTHAARWVMWMSKSEKVNQMRTDGVSFSERVEGEFKRLSWSAKGLPPIIAERMMPPMNEIAQRVSISTVPGWDTFGEWEKALLVDAYRKSPEVTAVAQNVLKGVSKPAIQIKKIHEYVIRNIRYQQDYEETIAGVKPHAAAQVIERQYGDCKDKAVLFIALAREVGLDVHFTSVRTRDRGPLLKGVPSQQFNHAIVYVPKQTGIDEGRFYDPTVDTLDLDVLRNDDQGTLAYIYDARNKRHYWKRIPFQSPETNHLDGRIEVDLHETGEVSGRLGLSGRGQVPAYLRREARNAAQFKRTIVQALVNSIAPGGQVETVTMNEVDALDKPVDLTIDFKGKGKVRREGREQRWKVPIGGTSADILSVKNRKYPYLMGPMSQFTWRVRLNLPKGARVLRLPSPFSFEHECLTYERRFTQTKQTVVVQQTKVSRCDRVSVDRVKSLQKGISAIKRSEEAEIVLRYR